MLFCSSPSKTVIHKNQDSKAHILPKVSFFRVFECPNGPEKHFSRFSLKPAKTETNCLRDDVFRRTICSRKNTRNKTRKARVIRKKSSFCHLKRLHLHSIREAKISLNIAIFFFKMAVLRKKVSGPFPKSSAFP